MELHLKTPSYLSVTRSHSLFSGNGKKKQMFAHKMSGQLTISFYTNTTHFLSLVIFFTLTPCTQTTHSSTNKYIRNCSNPIKTRLKKK